MSEDERWVYEKLKKEFVLELSDNKEITAANAAALSGKLCQLSNGAIYNDDGEIIEIERLISKAKSESHYERKKRPRKEIRAEKAAFFARRKAKIAHEKEKARLKAEAMAKKKEETA